MKSRVKPVRRTKTRPGGKPRGRPRSHAAREAILAAARELLSEGGPGAVTMEAVAARAGVGKPTVYRWWPDRHAVAMAALMAAAPGPAAARQASALQALRAQLYAIVERFASNTGRHVASLLAASDPESELSKAFRNHFVLARRSEGKTFLAEAVTRGEVRSDLDVEIVLDMLYGPLFFRLLLGHAPLDSRCVDATLDTALRGLR
jgi:AcrR family transcriptional regulator